VVVFVVVALVVAELALVALVAEFALVAFVTELVVVAPVVVALVQLRLLRPLFVVLLCIRRNIMCAYAVCQNVIVPPALNTEWIIFITT